MSDVPSITLYACGGTGINMARRLLKSEPSLKDVVTIVRLDSSDSNVVEGEALQKIVPDNVAAGAGKVRGAIATDAQQYIANASQKMLQPSDINIVLFSMSGGTGSVVAPFLIQKLANQGKRVVAFALSGHDSQLDIDNAIGTIKSLDKVCDACNAYLPIQLFDNYFGREIVNVTFTHRLSILIMMLTQETRELDVSDRINWLNGGKTSGAAPGLKPMHVLAGNRDENETSGEIWFGVDNQIVDAVLDIGIDNEADMSQPAHVSAGAGIKSRARYSGVFIKSLTPKLGIIGVDMGSLVDYFSSRKDSYDAHDLLVL